MSKSKFKEIEEDSDNIMKGYIIERMEQYLMKYDLEELLKLYLKVKEEGYKK
tara:strand:- start:1749 stop:1904 length:156 start_codon:yes stop_codon:yes gene_type:complete